MKDISEILTDLLTRYPESRKTDNIYKVIEWMLKFYGAITPDGRWDSQKYKEMPCISGIYRRLIEVKKLHNWFDEKAMKQEIEHRESEKPQTIQSTTQAPKPPQSEESERKSDSISGVDVARKAFENYQSHNEAKEFEEWLHEGERVDTIEEAKKIGWELK